MNSHYFAHGAGTGAIQGFFPAGRPKIAGSALPSSSSAAPVASAKLPASFSLPPGAGQPLPDHVRKDMESIFQTDFGRVRVHISAQAASIGALAFTSGDTVVFAPGQYAPETPRGQQLLAHELAHVVQQRSGQVRNPFGGLAIVQDPALEREADLMGQRAAHRAIVQPKKSVIAAAPVMPQVPVPQPAMAGAVIQPVKQYLPRMTRSQRGAASDGLAKLGLSLNNVTLTKRIKMKPKGFGICAGYHGVWPINHNGMVHRVPYDFTYRDACFDRYEYPGRGGKVTITYSGSRAVDFARANRRAGFAATPAGYTWHHMQGLSGANRNQGRMQLVLTAIHARVPHRGGVEQYERFHHVHYA